MMARAARLYKPLVGYFTINIRNRALNRDKWKEVQQVASILDPASETSTKIQAGRKVFVEQSAHLFTILRKSFTSGFEDNRPLTNWDGPIETMLVANL